MSSIELSEIEKQMKILSLKIKEKENEIELLQKQKSNPLIVVQPVSQAE